MRLHLEVRGSGSRDLVLLHGWGLHGGVWEETARHLAPGWRIHIPDLPGHGHSPPLNGPYTLCAFAEAVARQVPRGAYWLGWSLGGLVALQAATATDAAPCGLILVASNPSFVQRPDWPHAMAPETLDGFQMDLERDPGRAVKRFLALQTYALPHARAAARGVRRAFASRPPPAPPALVASLAILRQDDLRTRLQGLPAPPLFLLGERDALIPPGVGQDLVRICPSTRVAYLPGAGHALILDSEVPFQATVEAHLNA